MATASVTHGLKMNSMEFVLDYDPQDPFVRDFDPPTDPFDRKNENEYYWYAGMQDGMLNISTRVTEVPPSTHVQEGYNEGYDFGNHFYKFLNFF